MNGRFIGGILLVAGTSIGGGMLALPLVNASLGFWPSTGVLLGIWAIMTLGAFFILEVNLYFPKGSNLISMASQTLGRPGVVFTWTIYSLLLYALLCSYISGGSDLLQSGFKSISFDLKSWQASLLFTLFLGSIAYSGIHWVDKLNRWFMVAKFMIYFLVILLLVPSIHYPYLNTGMVSAAPFSLMVIVTAFGFAIIVPQLRDYFNSDLKSLKRVVFIGSLIPLLAYLLWNTIIMGNLPATGHQGLIQLVHDENPSSSLALLIAEKISNPFIVFFFDCFLSLCMLTAFLGVSLCMIGFLSDGLQLKPEKGSGILLFSICFLPPWLIVVFDPGIYIRALQYAGYCSVALLLLLPASMSLGGRHRQKRKFIVPGGILSQVGLITIALGIMLKH